VLTLENAGYWPRCSTPIVLAMADFASGRRHRSAA
jgi:hypothetical protein